MTFLNLTDELNYYELRHAMYQKIRTLTDQKGYISMEPTFFEDYDAFFSINQRVNKQSLVKMIDDGGKILILRPDITTSIIKHVVPKWDNRTSLKLSYLSTIFQRSSAGRIEEKKQFGIEYLGNPSLEADHEVLSLVYDVLRSYDLNFMVEISDTRFLDDLIQQLSLNKNEEKILKGIIYKKDQYALTSFLNQENQWNGYKKLLEHIFDLQGTIQDIRLKLKDLHISETMNLAINSIETLLESMDPRLVNDKTTIDLSILSQYDYYQGTTFKAYIQGLSSPILSGGRYDPLTKLYGKDIPAVGFTLNINDLLKEVIRSNE